MPVMDVATAWAQRFGLAGRRVRVAGRLRAVTSRCTEMACPAGACCNQCVARQELVGAASRAFELGADDDASFACAGDDSGLCCGTAAPRGDVVVRGVLRPVPESGGRWRIASPAPCAP